MQIPPMGHGRPHHAGREWMSQPWDQSSPSHSEELLFLAPWHLSLWSHGPKSATPNPVPFLECPCLPGLCESWPSLSPADILSHTIQLKDVIRMNRDKEQKTVRSKFKKYSTSDCQSMILEPQPPGVYNHSCSDFISRICFFFWVKFYLNSIAQNSLKITRVYIYTTNSTAYFEL